MRNRVAVFISGTGSNLNAALDMRDHVEIALVVSSKRKALGLLKAKRAGVPTLCVSNPVNWKELTLTLREHRIDSIFLLGFMKILPADFVKDWEGRMVNIHPSLLPAYPGLESIKKSFEDKSKMGVTVHQVTAKMDAGPILLQRECKGSRALHVHESEIKTEFEIHRSEHRLVREVLAKWNRAVMS